MQYTNRTSTSDLYKICEKLNINNIVVCRKKELKNYLDLYGKQKDYIINLDDKGDGSHWVFYSPKHNIYFDSYAQKAPDEIPKNTKLASTKKELQSIESSFCGGLCCLFAYYINNKSKKDFYSLFKDIYH